MVQNSEIFSRLYLWLQRHMILLKGVTLKEDSWTDISFCFLWLLRAHELSTVGFWPVGKGWAMSSFPGSCPFPTGTG